ncbi:MAG TPA: DUF4340 domain-containing protein [Thermoanaerobaculia bacterium]|jgi:hypothetical protein|nr:DUF4340 domain-containing protein [Thermoanaerobaculia bacterium]
MSPRKLLALTAVVVALVAFIFFVERKMPTTEERARKGDLYWDIPQDRIERIELARAGETLEFQRAGAAGWRMIKPEKYPADAFAVGGVVSDLAGMKRAGGEDSAEAKASDYGFATPVAKATIVWSDPGDPKTLKTRTVEFGANIPGTDVVAARVEGTEKVLFVPAAVLVSLRKNADDFESREVFGGAAADVARFEILRGRGQLAFARKDAAWWLAEPMADLADRAEVDRLVGALAGLRVKEFIHGGQDLAAIGLNPPLFHVSLTGAKGAVTAVDFGATRSDGNTVYARREGQVLTVDRDIMDDLSKEAEAFRSRGLLGFNRSDVIGVEAAFTRGNFVLAQKDGGWTVGGKPLSAAAADDVLTGLGDVRARDFLDDASVKGLALPVATVTVRTKTGPPWTLSLHPRSGEMVARVVPRPGGFLVDRDAPDKLEGAFRKAAATLPTPLPRP